MIMKKKILVFFTFLVSIFTFNCSKNSEDVNIENKNNSILMRTSGSCTYGEIHNDFMTFFYNDFETNDSLTSKSDSFNHVIDFFKDKSKDYNKLLISEIELLDSSFITNIELIDTRKLNSIMNNDDTILNPFTNTQITLSNLILELKLKNIISNPEFEELNNLQTFLNETFEGRITYIEFNIYLEETSTRIHGKGYKLIEPLICIGNSSNEWWTTNTPDIDLPLPFGDQTYPSDEYVTYAIPIVVANDIAGAIITTSIGVGAQYIATGTVNWQVIGIAAVGGAIAGSTGLLGKLSKWIRKW